MSVDISQLIPLGTDVQKRILLEMNKIAASLQDSRVFDCFPKDLRLHLEQLQIANFQQEEALKRAEQVLCYLYMLAGNARGTQQQADAWIVQLGRDMLEDAHNRRLLMAYPDGVDYKQQAYEYEEAFERICSKLKVKRMPAPQRVHAAVQATILLTNKLNYLNSSLNMQKKHAADQDRLAEAYTGAITELYAKCRLLADSNQQAERKIGYLRDYLQVYQAHDGSLTSDVAHLRDALEAKQSACYQLEKELYDGYQANARLYEEASALRTRMQELSKAELACRNDAFALRQQVSVLNYYAAGQQRLDGECKYLRQKIKEQQQEAVYKGIVEESLRAQLLSEQQQVSRITKCAAELRASLSQQEKACYRLDSQISLLWYNYEQETALISEERSQSSAQLQSLREEWRNYLLAARQRVGDEHSQQLVQQRGTISDLRQALTQSKARILGLEQENRQLTCSRALAQAQPVRQPVDTASAGVQTPAAAEAAEHCSTRSFGVQACSDSARPQAELKNAQTSTVAPPEAAKMAESTLDGFLTGVKRDLGLSVSGAACERGVQTVPEPYEARPDYEALLEVAKDLRAENDSLRYQLKAKSVNSSACSPAAQNASVQDRATQNDVEKNLRAYLFVYYKQILYLKKQIARYETYIQSLHLDDDEIVKIVVGEDSLESRKISELESLVHVLQLQLCEI